MVALQGQDLPAVLRAIAVRSRPGTTLDDVRSAFNTGELVRGWTQRGTLFVTTPDDLAQLASLTAERVHRAGRRTREAEGLDTDVLARAERVARKALAAPEHEGGISRAALLDLWQRAGVSVEGQRGYHLIVTLALRGVLHWGPFAGEKQLIVATPGSAARDARPDEPGAALRRIALSYFASRGPATPDDLAWWLGLPKVPVRTALATVRDRQPDAVAEVVVGGKPMLIGRDASGLFGRTAPGPPEPSGVVLVPGFDEIVLGYQDRELVADAEALRTVVPFTNGIFRPAILLDGRLVGTWRRAPKRDEAPFELVPGIRASARAEVEAAVAAWPLG